MSPERRTCFSGTIASARFVWESGRSYLTLHSREDCSAVRNPGRVGLRGWAPAEGSLGSLGMGAFLDDSGHHAATDRYSIGLGSVIRLMAMLQTRFWGMI